jgi:hypothetical protein
LLKQHHGRVFNTAGDAILAEFPSAVEAVRCATEIQAALQTRNAHLPPEQKMLFRMGINLGDVVVQEGDLLGDGVNVASRIQTVAEPGGICISGSVYDQIQNKLSLQFKPLGEQQFKNVGQPVRTFTITHGEAGALPVASSRNRKAIVIAAVAAAVVSALAAGGYSLYRENEAKRAEQAALTAQLAAERQAADEARRKAEEQSRRATEAESKAERERLVAESTKREAALQAQLQSAEGARARAEADRKRLDEERQRIEEQNRATEARAAEARAAEEKRAAEGRGREARKGRAASTVASLETAKTSAVGSTRGATGATPFDGAYAGQVCNNPADAAKMVCWQVPLKVENGAASGTWARRAIGKSSSVSITIAADGAVTATLDGWNVKTGSPMAGAMNGRAADNRIDIEGRWAPGLRVAGHWTRK